MCFIAGKNETKLTQKTLQKSSNNILNETVADFPVGPPGYGLPSEISTLDRVLIKASGNGCALSINYPLP